MVDIVNVLEKHDCCANETTCILELIREAATLAKASALNPLAGILKLAKDKNGGWPSLPKDDKGVG